MQQRLIEVGNEAGEAKVSPLLLSAKIKTAAGLCASLGAAWLTIIDDRDSKTRGSVLEACGASQAEPPSKEKGRAPLRFSSSAAERTRTGSPWR
jgi:hypothetical protein